MHSALDSNAVLQSAMHMRAIHFSTLTCYTFSFNDLEIITLHVMLCIAMCAGGVTSRELLQAVSRRVALRLKLRLSNATVWVRDLVYKSLHPRERCQTRFHARCGYRRELCGPMICIDRVIYSLLDALKDLGP